MTDNKEQEKPANDNKEENDFFDFDLSELPSNYEKPDGISYEVAAKTKGHDKVLNYFKHELSRNPEFIKKLSDIQKNFFTKEKVGIRAMGLRKGLDILCLEYGLNPVQWRPFLVELVTGDPSEKLTYPKDVSSCFVRDFIDETERNVSNEDISLLELTYPIAIAVNPYASQREITDYVKKAYKTIIEPLQKKYRSAKSKQGKINKRKAIIQERNDFIYENRHLSRWKIMEMVTDKFPKLDPIDYAYVSKIISNEKKKRKEV